MTVQVALAALAAQALLEGRTRLAQVMQQGGQLCQQPDRLRTVPVVFIGRAQHIAAGRVGRHGTFSIEAPGIPHNPQQFTVVAAADPVAGHGGVLACGFAQQFAQGIQAILGDRRLPGAVATAFGELVQNPARLGQCTFVALADQQDVHRPT